MQVCLYFYLGGSIAAKIVTFIVCIVLLVSYVKVIRTISANTRALLSLPDVVSTADTPPTDAPSGTPTDVPDDQQRSA